MNQLNQSEPFVELERTLRGAHGEPTGRALEKRQLGQQLSILAHLNGISQVDLAKKCQISRISINRFFRGRSELKAGDLLRLLAELGIDIPAKIEQKLKQDFHTFSTRSK